MVERLTDSKPTVAVVVPNLNQGSYLEEALVSIISQDGIDIYLAVLDAGSSDNSRSIINKYEKYIHYWRSHQDDGQAAAINEGVFNLPKQIMSAGLMQMMFYGTWTERYGSILRET